MKVVLGNLKLNLKIPESDSDLAIQSVFITVSWCRRCKKLKAGPGEWRKKTYLLIFIRVGFSITTNFLQKEFSYFFSFIVNFFQMPFPLKIVFPCSHASSVFLRDP